MQCQIISDLGKSCYTLAHLAIFACLLRLAIYNNTQLAIHVDRALKTFGGLWGAAEHAEQGLDALLVYLD